MHAPRDLGPIALLLVFVVSWATGLRADGPPELVPMCQLNQPANSMTVLRARAAPAPVAVDDLAPYGYLYEPAFSVDHLLRCPARPYVPQPGDIFLATDERFIARWAHLIAHSGAPHHSGIVFALPDGRPALLEGGPYGGFWIRVLDLRHQLESYNTTKRVWIRQRLTPLTTDQSHRLTVFALAAADRPFAEVRLWSQANPLLKAKGPIRTRLIGRPFAADFDPADPDAGMRQKYFCSELVTEGCVAAGLLPPDTTRPMSMYPRELFFGTSRIPYIRDHLDMSGWQPPSRWTVYPGAEPTLREHPFVDGDSGSIRRSP